MKKIRFISLAALLLCMITVFASCGAGGILKYVDVDVDADKPIVNSTKLEYGTLSDSRGDLASFVDLSTDKAIFRVFNVSTNNVVYNKELTLEAYALFKVKLYDIENKSYFVEYTYNAGNISAAKLYSDSGAIIAESAKDPEYKEICDKMIVFNNAVYMIGKKGDIEKSFDIDEFGYHGSSINISYAGDKYIYFEKSDAIPVTKFDGTFVSAYNIKQHYKIENWFVLENGNIVIQYKAMLEDNAKSYDFVEESEDKLVKYDLITEVFNVKKGSSREVDVDFIIDDILNRNNVGFDSSGMVEDFDLNMAEVRFIENKRVSKTSEFCVLGNNLNVKSAFSDIVDGGRFAYKVADNLFAVPDKYGMVNFVNKSGKLLKSICSDSIEDINSKHIVTDESIYDFKFNKVYDVKGGGYKVESVGNDFVILSKETADGTEYSRFSNGTVNVIRAANSSDKYYGEALYGALYCIKVYGDNGVIYNYYNSTGTLVAAYDDFIQVELTTESGFALIESGGNYYRLSLQA